MRSLDLKNVDHSAAFPSPAKEEDATGDFSDPEETQLVELTNEWSVGEPINRIRYS
jgi:hypothetical protein